MRTHGSTASDYNNRNACDRPNTGIIGESRTIQYGPYLMPHMIRVVSVLGTWSLEIVFETLNFSEWNAVIPYSHIS